MTATRKILSRVVASCACSSSRSSARSGIHRHNPCRQVGNSIACSNTAAAPAAAATTTTNNNNNCHRHIWSASASSSPRSSQRQQRQLCRRRSDGRQHYFSSVAAVAYDNDELIVNGRSDNEDDNVASGDGGNRIRTRRRPAALMYNSMTSNTNGTKEEIAAALGPMAVDNGTISSTGTRNGIKNSNNNNNNTSANYPREEQPEPSLHHDADMATNNNNNKNDGEADDMPPPLPQPKYSVFKRVLPSQLTAYSSQRGRQLLLQSIAHGYAEPYWILTEQFMNQSDPAFCGVTTLLVCLNALSIDPNIRWKGGWRFYASEDVLLNGCCLSKERILREGIVMDVFARLAICHGLQVQQKHAEPLSIESGGGEINDNRNTTPSTPLSSTVTPTTRVTTKSSASTSSRPTRYHNVDDFRADVRSVLSDTTGHNPLLVVSFSRQALGQTGDGHFSPIAAYNDVTDEVLVLDVARFKYAPYWTSVQDMYRAMQDVDKVSQRPRGWFILQPPKSHRLHLEEEDRRPVEVVPEAGQRDICPINPIKIEFCNANPKWRDE